MESISPTAPMTNVLGLNFLRRVTVGFMTSFVNIFDAFDVHCSKFLHFPISVHGFNVFFQQNVDDIYVHLQSFLIMLPFVFFFSRQVMSLSTASISSCMN